MLWLYIAIASYILFAGANIFDRYILRGPVQHPRAYVFYIGASGIFAAFLIPLDFRVPPGEVVILSIFAGSSVIGALYYLYKGIYEGHVSTQVAMVGAFAPLFTLLFGYLIVGERVELSARGALAFNSLILGIIFLAGSFKKHHLSFSKRDILNAVISGALFGLGFILTRMVYITETFINGYIWTTLGGVVLALMFLLLPGTKEMVFKKAPVTEKKVLLPLLAGKGMGALGNVAQNYAISLATFSQVAFISALAGVQHLAILMMAIILFLTRPHLLEEEFTKGILAMRFAGVLFVGLGIYLLAT